MVEMQVGFEIQCLGDERILFLGFVERDGIGEARDRIAQLIEDSTFVAEEEALLDEALLVACDDPQDPAAKDSIATETLPDPTFAVRGSPPKD